ncbi:MAG: hypothetical protein GH151_08815 [Bacteroidetes bacterium]|nr:hypothetical protein [Bacteroidota bacterium]
MKKLITVSFVFIILLGCEEGGLFDFIFKPDRHFSLPNDRKFIFNEGDTIIYRSNYYNLAKYEILKIWNGECKVTRGGTEGKPPFDYREFQCIYIDSLGKELSVRLQYEFSAMPILIGAQPHGFNECISIVNIAEFLNVRVNWYDELDRLGFQIDETFKTTKILYRRFENVFVYKKETSEIEIQDNQIIIWYYTYKMGFVGFEYKYGEIFEIIN